ncbi:hypothetical protein [Kitasatospora aureofaciens]|uniref:hypothetical protein n=1 Tax=Kitasatospora aureofaciens TaxID=1894 RepID=UPI0037C99C53
MKQLREIYTKITTGGRRPNGHEARGAEWLTRGKNLAQITYAVVRIAALIRHW